MLAERRACRGGRGELWRRTLPLEWPCRSVGAQVLCYMLCSRVLPRTFFFLDRTDAHSARIGMCRGRTFNNAPRPPRQADFKESC